MKGGNHLDVICFHPLLFIGSGAGAMEALRLSAPSKVQSSIGALP